MFFTFAPLVGVENFRAFFGRERCVLCFCALKKNASGHPLRILTNNYIIRTYLLSLSLNLFIGPIRGRNFVHSQFALKNMGTYVSRAVSLITNEFARIVRIIYVDVPKSCPFAEMAGKPNNSLVVMGSPWSASRLAGTSAKHACLYVATVFS
jgi:hypothetical protein